MELSINEKQCVHCKEIKPYDYFYKHSDYPDKLAKECKTCCSARAKKNYATNESLRETIKSGMLRRKYNLTIAQHNLMLEQQKGLCAICKHPEIVTNSGVIRTLAVDYDHITGKICGNCNLALGKLKDNKDLVTAMLEYIIKYEDK